MADYDRRILASLASATPPLEEDNRITEIVGRFGHHPDPADDFCIEVECLQGEWDNHKTSFMNGTPPIAEVEARVFRAMTAGPFITEHCLNAKAILRQIEQEMRT